MLELFFLYHAKYKAFVAQWIAHQTSNLGVAGSNPVECFYQIKYHTSKTIFFFKDADKL